MSSYDIVIKGGTVLDGTGSPGQRGDVGIVGDRVVEIGQLSGTATRTIDAEGRLVTPGFVDIHSHLDAQVAWDPQCSSSCWHGVTSVVVGNCGVTFAPVRPSDHELLAKLMESVEDIPAEAILSGLSWDWHTYGEYYDMLGRLPKGINVGGMVGHCAVRFYAMGERSIDRANNPTAEELTTMVAMVDEAMAAGALGFSSSRVLGHRTPDGRPVPGTFALPDELIALSDPLRKWNRGVFEVVPRFETDKEGVWNQARAEVDWMAAVSRHSGRPLTFAFFQFPHLPEQYRKIMELATEANASGANLRPQSTARGIGILFGAQIRSPFDRSPVWKAMRSLPLADKLGVYADVERRAELIAQAEANGPFAADLDRHYLLTGPSPDYRPDPAKSLPAIAASRGVTMAEAYMDIMVESDGRTFFSHPLLNPSFDAVQDMLNDTNVVLGLADAGAHVSQIMDASQPTWFLTHWVRDREVFTIEDAIRRLTSDTAQLFGIEGRGILAPGAYADVNVLDFDGMALGMPDYAHDFPGGAGRLVQRADGYDYTLVNGQVFMESGEHTGVLAGDLLRSGPDRR